MRCPEELKPTLPPKTIGLPPSWSLVFNTKANVKSQELNVKEVLLANPSVVMLLMLNNTNTVGP